VLNANPGSQPNTVNHIVIQDSTIYNADGGMAGHCTGTFTARSVSEDHTLRTVKTLEFGSFYLGSREDHHTRLRADRPIGIVQAALTHFLLLLID